MATQGVTTLCLIYSYLNLINKVKKHNPEYLNDIKKCYRKYFWYMLFLVQGGLIFSFLKIIFKLSTGNELLLIYVELYLTAPVSAFLIMYFKSTKDPI